MRFLFGRLVEITSGRESSAAHGHRKTRATAASVHIKEKPVMLNRSAVVVRYRGAFRDWLRSIGVEEEEFDDHADKSVYLVAECNYPQDSEEILRESCSAIFYEEVSAWHLDPEQYPDFNDIDLFNEWFETEYFDMVSDALDEPLTKSE